MSNVRVNTVMDSDLLNEVDAYARERREDRSTAIRPLVAFALQEQRTREAMQRVKNGRLTLREFAAELHLDLWEAQDSLAAARQPAGLGTAEETAADLDSLTHLVSHDLLRESSE